MSDTHYNSPNSKHQPRDNEHRFSPEPLIQKTSKERTQYSRADCCTNNEFLPKRGQMEFLFYEDHCSRNNAGVIPKQKSPDCRKHCQEIHVWRSSLFHCHIWMSNQGFLLGFFIKIRCLIVSFFHVATRLVHFPWRNQLDRVFFFSLTELELERARLPNWTLIY